MPLPRLANLIDGRLVPPRADHWLDVFEPATGEVFARCPDADILSIGSSLKFCMLAEGRADLYPRLGRTMEWDTAAGDAVLRAAGGNTVTMDGEPLTYGKRCQQDDVDFANPWFIAKGHSGANTD